jgi:hypothetical protein
MGVLLQGFYKMMPNDAVPSPVDGDDSIPWWWDHLAEQAAALRAVGFTAIWLPPVLKTSAGAKSGSDGYGPFDDYDMGSKNQMGTEPTRFGTREQLQRCVATMRATGIDVYVDLVEHHRNGDPGNFEFRYRGADGTPNIGRFPKHPDNFRPNVPQDPHLGGAPSDDFMFGRELCPINAKPPRYVFDNLIDAADWLTRSLDVQGYRLDDVKGLSTDFLLPFLNAKAMAGKFAVGEFFDGNRVLVNGWIFNPRGMQGRPSAFDFPLRFVLAQMCNNPGNFNMASLDHTGLIGISPMNAVTFIENHDTDLNPSRVISNKLLGYAYILTSEGYPCVYYRDYSTDKNCYGLKQQLDNLIWIHEKLADGPTVQRWLDFDVFAYERLGGSHLLVGLNNDPNNFRTIGVATGFGAGVTLHDYTGHHSDVTTGADSTVTITIPPNNNGLGYVCYSRLGFAGGFDVASKSVTQLFQGAPDLDIPPASHTAPLIVGHVWSCANSAIVARLTPDMSHWAGATAIKIEVLAPDSSVIGSAMVTLKSEPHAPLTVTAPAAGFHAIRLTATATPATNLDPAFSLSVTYTGDLNFRSAPAAANPQVRGQWSAPFPLRNVAIHSSVLPNGKVLYWGRRKQPTDNSFASLNEWQTHAFVLDPKTLQSVPTANSPVDHANTTINLFCSSHTFLADGKLMVVGGHLFDSQGHNAATIYDFETNSWNAAAPMQRGRWYPTAVTLADGGIMVCSGSYTPGTPAPLPSHPIIAINGTPEIWSGGTWKSLTDFSEQLDLQQFLYPRFHINVDGRVFMSGTSADSFFFDSNGTGTWSQAATRAAKARDYAPSVMYDSGKILYIGGGNAADGTHAPTDVVEKIDLNAAKPLWSPAASMHFPRRQHNATLLPDGTVLVTGGTRGGGGPSNGFNDLSPGNTVHSAELWDPNTDTWTLLSDERTDRCYHSTAVLLPDGRVLSAGGGEYQPDPNILLPNAPANSHLDAQIFSPPYLFKGARPTISNAPVEIRYGTSFQVTTPDAATIIKASLLRLSSATHSFNSNQHINFLDVQPQAGSVSIKAPANANLCPPGHYCLFLLNASNVPSIGSVVRISGSASILSRIAVRAIDPVQQDAEMIATAKRPPVVVGLSATCPYGLASCWGGAYAGLKRMSGVEKVRPLADPDASVAYLYLNHDGLPDLEGWPLQFTQFANGSYVWRGVEVTLSGAVTLKGGALSMPANKARPQIDLLPLRAEDVVQLKHDKDGSRILPFEEANAYAQLALRSQADAAGIFSVTGPLKQMGSGYALEIRVFSQLSQVR